MNQNLDVKVQLYICYAYDFYLFSFPIPIAEINCDFGFIPESSIDHDGVTSSTLLTIHFV